jgi:predicted O-methyltransferase YrrM
MIYQTNPNFAMDSNHIDLIGSLIKCSKPNSILEIGVGSGLVTKVIIDAVNYNQMLLNLTCVDNFLDWNGNTPPGFGTFRNIIKFIKQSEKEFIHSCNQQFDFIVSDADHHHTNEWIDRTFSLLAKNGILIYHDVTNINFTNLYDIINYVKMNNIRYSLFNKSSLNTERCERGLLVIYKD